MSEAFTQGSIGEVPLSAALALHDKAFWTLSEKMVAADVYERQRPGVTVKRDWETPEQHAARLKARSEEVRPAEPTQGMDPARARPELLRYERQMEGLTIDHPQYEKLFDAWVPQIHMLQDMLGIKRTEYKKGYAPKRKQDVVDKATVAKFAEYRGKQVDTRRRSIEATKDLDDLDFLALIRDQETLPDLQALAVQRIEQVKAV